MRLIVLAAAIALTGMAQINAQENIADSLEIGGQLRFRADMRDANGVTAGLDSQSGQTGRLRLNFGATINEYNKVFVELQNSMGEPGGVFRATSNVGGNDMGGNTVHQAYVKMENLVNDMFDLKMGRMELKYGNQRMISPLDWSNTGHAWDAMVVSRSADGYKADMILSQAVIGQGAPDANDSLYGIYFERTFGDIDVDFYTFHRHLNIGFSDDTFGFLAEGANFGANWSVEYATQTGDHNGIDAGGSALAMRADMAVQEGLTVGLGYELASGVDGTDDAFRPLYNFAHAYQGHQDIVTWSNLQDIVIRTKYVVASNWNAHADLHMLSKAEDNDAIYFGGGAGAGAADIAGEGDIGTEIDVYMKGSLSKNVGAWFGVSQFSAGDAIVNGEDQSWIFAQLVFNF